MFGKKTATTRPHTFRKASHNDIQSTLLAISNGMNRGSLVFAWSGVCVLCDNVVDGVVGGRASWGMVSVKQTMAAPTLLIYRVPCVRLQHIRRVCRYDTESFFCSRPQSFVSTISKIGISNQCKSTFGRSRWAHILSCCASSTFYVVLLQISQSGVWRCLWVSVCACDSFQTQSVVCFVLFIFVSFRIAFSSLSWIRLMLYRSCFGSFYSQLDGFCLV